MTSVGQTNENAAGMNNKSNQGASGLGELGDVDGRMNVLKETSDYASATATHAASWNMLAFDCAANDCFAVKVWRFMSNTDLSELAHVGLPRDARLSVVACLMSWDTLRSVY